MKTSFQTAANIASVLAELRTRKATVAKEMVVRNRALTAFGTDEKYSVDANYAGHVIGELEQERETLGERIKLLEGLFDTLLGNNDDLRKLSGDDDCI